MSHQTEQTHGGPEVTTRSDQNLPTERATGARQQRGRIAMAIVTIAIGGGLTALVIGVTGDAGTDAEAPTNPGFQLPYQNELPPTGLDQRLYNLAEERAAERQATMKLAKQRLLNRIPPGADLRLYNLAEMLAAERYAR